MSLPGRNAGLIFTPGPAGMSVALPVAMSIDTSVVSLPGSGFGRRVSSVDSSGMQ